MGFGHGRGGRNLDVPLLPPIGAAGCAGILLVLLALGDMIAHGVIWVHVADGDGGRAQPLPLALDEAERYSLGCATVDVAALGVLRGLLVITAVATGGCDSLAGHAERALLPLSSARPRPQLPASALGLGLALLLALAASIAKAAAVARAPVCGAAAAGSAAGSAGGAESDNPWVDHREREWLATMSAVYNLLELLLYGLHIRMRLRTAARAASEAAEALLKGGGDKIKQAASLSRLVGLARGEVYTIGVGLLMLLVSTLSGVALPTVAGDIVDAISAKQGVARIDGAVGRLLIIVVIGAVCTSIRNYCFTLVGQRLVYRLRSQLFRAIISQETAFFDESLTGELLNRLSSDTQVMQSGITQNFSMFLRASASAVMAMMLMFTISWKLSLAVLCIIPFLICGTAVYGRFVQRLSKRVQDALAKATETAEQSLGNLRTVRAFSKEGYEIGTYTRSVYNAFKLGRAMAIASAGFMGGVFMMGQGAAAGVLWLGGRMVMEDELTIGQLTSFLLYVIMVASNLGMLSGIWPAFMTAVGASYKVFYLLDRVPAIKFEGGLVPTTPAKGAIRFDGVWFHYPPVTVKPAESEQIKRKAGKGKGKGGGKAGAGGGRSWGMGLGSDSDGAGGSVFAGAVQGEGSDHRPGSIQGAVEGELLSPQWVLREIDLDIAPGMTLALVGPSGAGKSTIFSLLERFYAPQRGSITFDGVNTMDLDPRWLRKQLAIVSQEPVLFGTSVLENIAYGDARAVADPAEPPPELTLEQEAALRQRVVECAKAANAHDFITSFPNGYDTMVGERGVKLSGGQKQRVAIARALLLDPAVLLLDEATSALDAESEHLVQAAIDNAMERRTVLIIAHRLSTVQNADVVCVVDDHKIVERGTHEELMAISGVYKALVQRQLQQASTFVDSNIALR